LHDLVRHHLRDLIGRIIVDKLHDATPTSAAH
jgi:hypothetical protein